MAEFSRSTVVSSNSGNQKLSNIPTPVLISGVDVYTGANACNIKIFDGANTGTIVLAMKTIANSSHTEELGCPVRCDSGAWLEFDAVLNASNVIIRYV